MITNQPNDPAARLQLTIVSDDGTDANYVMYGEGYDELWRHAQEVRHVLEPVVSVLIELRTAPPPEMFKGRTAVEVLAWDRGWRAASFQVRELYAGARRAPEHCPRCGSRNTFRRGLTLRCRACLMETSTYTLDGRPVLLEDRCPQCGLPVPCQAHRAWPNDALRHWIGGER